MNALVPRATIDQIEARRDAAILAYGQAFDALAHATQAHSAASYGAMTGGADISRGRYQSATYYSLKEREKFLEDITKDVDRSVWSYLIDAFGLERLMDTTAREQFRAEMAANPPPATADNCHATLSQLIGDADLIFKRGIATAFSKLDRRFRSHDGFKIGTRVVLSNAFGVDGFWNHYRRQDEVLRDVERVFWTLDGKQQPERSGGIIGAIDTVRGRGFRARAYTAENEYFEVRVFKNGNAHLWFKRKDLTDKVNLLLADYYGEALGVGPDQAETKEPASGRMARHFGLFETPEAVAGRVIEEASLYSRDGSLMVLEPSAGRGRLAKPARAKGAVVHCIEIQPELARQLQADGFPTINGDFLQQKPLALYDRVIMNPPFDRGLDVEHVTHAFDFVKPGGRLVAIMAAGVEYREDRRTVAFRTMVERFRGSFRDLPPGSFAESGTNVNTVIVTMEKPA